MKIFNMDEENFCISQKSSTSTLSLSLSLENTVLEKPQGGKEGGRGWG